ncbi:MAG: SCO family protein [Alcanivorax sp.]|nr:SCO family protein [Alcanivorax sp.]
MKKLVLMAVAVMLILAAVVAWETTREPAREPLPVNTRMGGDFTMTDQRGEAFHSDALKGQVVLLFFGFTHCPDICPATMARMTQLYKNLEAAGQADDVQMVFITFDPERDTPEHLSQYLTWFHEDIIGLTGSEEQVEQVAKQFGVVFMPVGEDSQGGVEFAHSDFVYLLDRESRVRKLYPVDADLKEMQDDLLTLL